MCSPKRSYDCRAADRRSHNAADDRSRSGRLMQMKAEKAIVLETRLTGGDGMQKSLPQGTPLTKMKGFRDVSRRSNAHPSLYGAVYGQNEQTRALPDVYQKSNRANDDGDGEETGMRQKTKRAPSSGKGTRKMRMAETDGC